MPHLARRAHVPGTKALRQRRPRATADLPPSRVATNSWYLAAAAPADASGMATLPSHDDEAGWLAAADFGMLQPLVPPAHVTARGLTAEVRGDV